MRFGASAKRMRDENGALRAVLMIDNDNVYYLANVYISCMHLMCDIVR